MTTRSDRAASPPRPRPPRLMRAALTTAADGHYVFPLWPRSKRPAVTGWETHATTNPDDIRRLWDTLSYNVGIACGPSGLHVLDLDDAHGDDPPDEWAGARHGRDVLARLAREAGEPYPVDTYTVCTPPAACTCTSAPPTNLRCAARWRASDGASTPAAPAATSSPQVPSERRATTDRCTAPRSPRCLHDSPPDSPHHPAQHPPAPRSPHDTPAPTSRGSCRTNTRPSPTPRRGRGTAPCSTPPSPSDAS